MTPVLDSPAFIALDRNERPMWTRLKAAQSVRQPPRTHADVVGQVWRGGSRQARLAQALEGVDVAPVEDRKSVV